MTNSYTDEVVASIIRLLDPEDTYTATQHRLEVEAIIEREKKRSVKAEHKRRRAMRKRLELQRRELQRIENLKNGDWDLPVSDSGNEAEYLNS